MGVNWQLIKKMIGAFSTYPAIKLTQKRKNMKLSLQFFDICIC
jgi:hypothetical protein